MFRIAHKASVCRHAAFESSMRRLDEVGRMLYGWRQRVAGKGAPR